MSNDFYKNGFYLLSGAIAGFIIGAIVFYKPVTTNVHIKTPPIEKVQTFANDSAQLSEETLMKELIRQNVQHPEIVLAQAKLETGFFTSRACKEYNNLFGLMHGNKYYRFGTWQESVTAYRDYIQYRYEGGDYFKFLNDINYAEEPRYLEYVASLM